MSTISELDAAVEEYNGVVKRQQEANRAELEPLGLKIQQFQGQIIDEDREADKATTENSGEACPA